MEVELIFEEIFLGSNSPLWWILFLQNYSKLGTYTYYFFTALNHFKNVLCFQKTTYYQMNKIFKRMILSYYICLLKSLVLFDPFDQFMYPKSSLETPMMPVCSYLLCQWNRIFNHTNVLFSWSFSTVHLLCIPPLRFELDSKLDSIYSTGGDCY